MIRIEGSLADLVLFQGQWYLGMRPSFFYKPELYMSSVGLTCVYIDMFSPIQVSIYRDLQMGQIWQTKTVI